MTSRGFLSERIRIVRSSSHQGLIDHQRTGKGKHYSHSKMTGNVVYWTYGMQKATVVAINSKEDKRATIILKDEKRSHDETS